VYIARLPPFVRATAINVQNRSINPALASVLKDPFPGSDFRNAGDRDRVLCPLAPLS
jgi:hypothetical protein